MQPITNYYHCSCHECGWCSSDYKGDMQSCQTSWTSPRTADLELTLWMTNYDMPCARLLAFLGTRLIRGVLDYKWFFVLHLYSAICTASEAIFVNHLYSAHSQGFLRQFRLGFEHDTLRLLPLPTYAGMSLIRPACTSNIFCTSVIKND